MRFLRIQPSLKSNIRNFDLRCYCSTSESSQELSEEDQISKLRDKSKLPAHVKSIFLKQTPVHNPNESADYRSKRIEYNRKLYARFGEASGVNPGILWPSKEGLKDQIEFEEEFYPPLNELVEKVAEKRALEAETLKKR